MDPIEPIIIPPPPPGPERSGFTIRLFAWLIDVFASILLAIAAGFAAGGSLGAFLGGATANPGVGLVAGVAGFYLAYKVAGALYGVIEALTGRSPGKRILGLAVKNADGSAAAVPTYVLRYCLKNIGPLISLLVLLFGVPWEPLSSLLHLIMLAGCLLALTRDKQALHDVIAKTAVYPSR